MDRLIEVKTTRLEVDSPNSNSVTPKLAVELFRGVADHLGFVIEGPIQISKYQFEYTAHAPGKRPTNRTFVTLWVDTKEIRFISSIHGKLNDFAYAQQVAELFVQALDQRGIRYTLSTREATLIPP